MKLHNIIFVLVFLGCTQLCASQPRYTFDFYETTNLEAGYSYNFGEPNNKNFHLLSIGLNKTVFGGIHIGGYGYGIASDVGLNTKNFTIGPKINGFIYFQFIIIGSELAVYTDFKEATLRYIPIFGIGSDKIKLTINPQIILTNKSFEPIDRGAIQLTINFHLDKRLRKETLPNDVIEKNNFTRKNKN